MLAGLPRVASKPTAVARFCFASVGKIMGYRRGDRTMMYKRIDEPIFIWVSIVLLLVAGVLPGQCAMRCDLTPFNLTLEKRSADFVIYFPQQVEVWYTIADREGITELSFTDGGILLH